MLKFIKILFQHAICPLKYFVNYQPREVRKGTRKDMEEGGKNQGLA